MWAVMYKRSLVFSFVRRFFLPFEALLLISLVYLLGPRPDERHETGMRHTALGMQSAPETWLSALKERNRNAGNTAGK